MRKAFKMMAAAAAVLATVSCSQEDLMPQRGKTGREGAVGVNTYVANGSRGVALNNAGDLQQSGNGFDLFAFETETKNQFMGTADNGIEFAYNNGWDYATEGEVKFWRQVTDGNKVDFYAVSPANTTTLNIGYDAQTIAFEVAAQSANQKDLMYARTEDVDPTNEYVISNGVHLDFYHALSQIVFKARTTDEYLTAHVSEVEIVNLHDAGTFTVGNAAFSDYTADVAPWQITSTAADASYAAEVSETEVSTAADADAVTLTDSETALLLLPQDITGATIDDKATQPTGDGTYVRVKCHVTYKGTSDTEATDIYGTSSAYADLYISLNATWKAGYKYIYTLVFSKDISDPVTINEDLYVGPWYEAHDEHQELPNDEITPAADGSFYIYTAAQLADARDKINSNATYSATDATARSGESAYANATYHLKADIDLSGYENWTPIGNKDVCFRGTFEGNGKTISGVKIDMTTPTTDVYAGLFGYAEQARIMNLTVEGEYKASASNEVSIECGGIVGSASTVFLSNCHFKGSITVENGSNYNKAHNLGGIVAYAVGSQIIACTNTATVKDNDNDQNVIYVGGIVGRGISASIIACYNGGGVSASDDRTVGGILGHSNSCTITSCYNYSTSISVADGEYEKIGTIWGGNGDVTKLNNCYSVAVDGLELCGNNATSGISDCEVVDGTELKWSDSEEVENAMNLMNNALIEFASDNDSGLYNWHYEAASGNAPLTLKSGLAEEVTIPMFAGGDGTAENPFLISKAKHIVNMVELCAGGSGYGYKHYKLINDINMSGITNLGRITNFYGSLDGNGYKITNYNSKTSIIRDNYGTVKYLSISGSINDDGSEYGSVGGIVDTNRGTIEFCHSNLTMTATHEYNIQVGGIAGYNDEGVIKYCWNTGSVSGYEKTGGIVGYDGGNGTIIGCYNTGAVTSTSSDAGGIVGNIYNNDTECNASVKGCYNTGTISGSSNVNPIGYIFLEAGTASFSDCYYAGDSDSDGKSGTTNVDGTTTTWATATSAMNTAIGSDAGYQFQQGDDKTAAPTLVRVSVE